MSEATVKAAIVTIQDSLDGLTPFEALAALRITGNAIVTDVLAEEAAQLWEEITNERPLVD